MSAPRVASWRLRPREGGRLPGRGHAAPSDRAAGAEDVAAVIPVEHLELLRELVARQEAERRTAEIDWQRPAHVSPPPRQWFEGDEPKPF